MDDYDIPPCFIFVDKEGKWFHKGAEMVRREIIRFFCDRLELDHSGRYVIRLDEESCYIEVEDTPFVVQAVHFEEIGGRETLRISLNDDTREALRPESLYVGVENVLYCKVKEGRFVARFHRPAYYQLAEFVKEVDGEFYLPLNGRSHLIRCSASASRSVHTMI
jgi:hypothetical protein